MYQEVLDAFKPLFGNKSSIIVDCTLGGAGHTSSLLEYDDSLKVLASDVDQRAIHNAKKRLHEFKDRVHFYHGNFSTLVDLKEKELPQEFGAPWSGVLMDLGYSSNQLEDSEFGMSFQIDGELDMRLSRKGQTAWELLNECTEQELADIFHHYGEVEGTYRTARSIKQALQEKSLKNSTLSLAKLLERGVNRNSKKIHPATLVFQSLRIAVNDELRVLDHFLEGVILKMRAKGRIAVISFHSLEDRIVKRWGQKNSSQLISVHKKPIVASTEEIQMNPRSRSAKLRVFEVQ